jgi:predicted ATPase/class 3 adenylate cyclase
MDDRAAFTSFSRRRDFVDCTVMIAEPSTPITPIAPPSGTVTFLFTDIEGSTRLWERDATTMRSALERHNAILGEAIRAHSGYHFKTIGDAYQAAFADPVAAVAACVDAQRALAAEPWPETGPLRVRMALHRGPAEPSPNGDYLAPSLNRLSRILSSGYGGQVLLSSVVWETVAERLPDGVTAISLGKHRLRDLLEAEEIWQLVIQGLAATFPPLKSLEGHPTNLPQQPTALIGRDEEIARLRDLLAQESTRLITLTGPGGVGKTRLALAAAADSLETFPDGIFLVTLAGVGTAALLMPEIAAVLGVREGGGLSLEESVLAYLGGKRLLLVLDNLEQLQPFENAASTIATLLDAAPAVTIMATSRAPLRIRAEQEWPVSPLLTPAPGVEVDGEAALAELAASPAVALFVERARAARPAWRLTTANATDVAEIARRLDGLPLAIELAAARIRVLTPGEILRRLGGALDLLEARSGDRPDRQQTLRAAIAWSHELLRFEDQVAFRRLGVFSGGFTLEAAEQVLAETPDPWIDPLDAISVLVEQSLIRTEEDSLGETRYRMLETVRAFALEELSRSGEDNAVRAAHARWVDAFARDADTHVLGPDSGAWLSRYEREHDNFRAAIAWAIEHDPGDLGLRVPESLWRFWELRGHYTEARGWLERALAASPDAPAPLRALALEGLGNIVYRQGDLKAAAIALEESVAIWRSLNDPRKLAATLSNLGSVVEIQGDLDRAQALHEEALSIARPIGNPLPVATALNNLALVHWGKGDLERATMLLEESVAIKRQIGNQVGLAHSLNNLGILALDTGDPERAIAYLEETLAIDRELGNPTGIADSLGNLAGLIAPTGNVARAAALDAEALEIRRDLSDRLSVAHSLDSIAATASRAGFPGVGARLYGASERLREELGAPIPPSERARYETGLDMTRSALGDEAYETAWAGGRALSLDEAISEALDIAHQIAQSPETPA